MQKKNQKTMFPTCIHPCPHSSCYNELRKTNLGTHPADLCATVIHIKNCKREAEARDDKHVPLNYGTALWSHLWGIPVAAAQKVHAVIRFSSSWAGGATNTLAMPLSKRWRITYLQHNAKKRPAPQHMARNTNGNLAKNNRVKLLP